MVQSLLAASTYGPYVSWWKPIPLIIVILLWGRLVTWIDKDSQETMLPRVPLNIGNLVGAVLGLFLFFFLPGYAIAVLVFVAIIAIEAGVYLGMRNSKIGLGDLSGKFTAWMKSWGSGEKEVKVIQGEVQLINKQGNLMAAPEADDPIS